MAKKISNAEMDGPSEYGGDPKEPRRPKAPHEQLREMYRSNPADPASDGSAE